MLSNLTLPFTRFPTVDFEDDGIFVPCLISQCDNFTVVGGDSVSYDVISFTSYSTGEVAVPKGIFPIYVRPILSGQLQPNANFQYEFNFTFLSDCTGVLVSHSANITTDAGGIGFTTVDLANMTEHPQFLCEFRDGSLRKVHEFPDTINDRSIVNFASIKFTLELEPINTSFAPACDTLGLLYVDSSVALCFCDGATWLVTVGPGACA